MGRKKEKKDKKEKKGKTADSYPFVSICTPTFNRRPFIENMFQCFRHQTYPKSRLEWIIIDDSELSDLTRCLDLLRFDSRFNIRWDINQERPFSKKYIRNNLVHSNKYSNFFYALGLFLFTSTLLVFIPTNNKFEIREITNSTQELPVQNDN